MHVPIVSRYLLEPKTKGNFWHSGVWWISSKKKPKIFSNLNYNFSNLWDTRNLQEQVKKAFYYQNLFWPFTVWINCSSDLKIFSNSRPSALKFKSFSSSPELFFLTVCQNNFGNKIPFLKKNVTVCSWLMCRAASLTNIGGYVSNLFLEKKIGKFVVAATAATYIHHKVIFFDIICLIFYTF